jgi:hypothetical protein
MSDRQDKWANTVTIDGARWGVWSTLAGGDVGASETKFKPGGMLPERSLGGSVTVGNLTLTRLLDAPDWEPMRQLMINRVGKAPVVVARQPLDDDGNPFGKPLTYTGKLLNVNPGDTDSNSEGAQLWTILVSTDGSVA